jgi:hypothetical protein
MEIAFNRDYLDTFVILSGDSDFTPLVVRLKELNRRVIGIGTRGSTSKLIANVCDEFMFYDSLVKSAATLRTAPAPSLGRGRDGRDDDRDQDEDDDEDDVTAGKPRLDVAFNLLVETLQNYQRDEGGPVHASVLKTSMKRKLPTFNEAELGFNTFARFLERAQAEGLVLLAKDEKGGGVRVDLAGGGNEVPAAVEAPPPERRAPRLPRPVAEALDVLAADGLDIGLSVDRAPILDAFVRACAQRLANSRRLAVQYLQGDLVQEGHDAERVRGILGTLGRIGALLHPDGEPVRTPTAPIQAPASADELNELLEERALELLGQRRIRVGPLVREALFAPTPERAAPPVASAPTGDAPTAMSTAEPADADVTSDDDTAGRDATVVEVAGPDSNLAGSEPPTGTGPSEADASTATPGRKPRVRRGGRRGRGASVDAPAEGAD